MLMTSDQPNVRIPMFAVGANLIIAGLSGTLLAAGLSEYLGGVMRDAALGGGVALAAIPVGLFALTFVNNSPAARVAGGVIAAFSARLLASVALGVIVFKSRAPDAASFWLAFFFTSMVVLAFEVQKMQRVLRWAGQQSNSGSNG